MEESTPTILTDIRHSELARLIEKYGVDEGFRRYRDGEVIEEPKTLEVRRDCLLPNHSQPFSESEPP